MQRAPLAQRYSDEPALRRVGRLADRLRNLARLAVAEPDASLFVADHHERRETEPASTLHDFRHAVDMDELIGEFAFALFPVATLAWFTCHDFVPTCFPQ